MKRVGYLFDQIVDSDNIRLAFWKAQKGKSGKGAIQKFRQNLGAHLAEIRDAFLIGDFRLGNYTYFPVFDPKERMICAAAFRERVMQHAVMNVCETFFEVRQIYDSFACRKGKGLDACLKRTVAFCRQHGWYLKMDVHKYFDSIPHDRGSAGRLAPPILLRAPPRWRLSMLRRQDGGSPCCAAKMAALHIAPPVAVSAVDARAAHAVYGSQGLTFPFFFARPSEFRHCVRRRFLLKCALTGQGLVSERAGY